MISYMRRGASFRPPHITVKSESAGDLQLQSWYIRVLDSAPARGLCVTEFELSVVI